ncbi:MAG: hypothetical protein LUC83_09530 [Clostridiales bacterium]|nr:hypothetical protein [Clostridiales bacterium]
MSQFSETENKGQYCRFVQAADGSYALEPVKVPAHIIAEREERIRRRDICRHAQENRKRAESFNGASVFFLTLTICFFAVVCCLYLALQNRVSSRVAQITSLQEQIASQADDNDTREKRLATAEDLEEIAEIAQQKLGMCYVESEQIAYYSLDESDYMVQYDDIP